MSFSSLAQFGAYGLRREVLLPRGRAVTVVDPSTDTLGVAAHDWAGDEYLQIATVAVSAETPALPTGLSSTVVYRPLPVTGSDSLFQLSLTEGGSAVTFSDDGEGSFVVTEQLSATIQRFLDAAQARILEALTNYKGPIAEPYPTILIWVECKLAAFDMAIASGLVVPSYWEQARETISKHNDEALAYLEDWARGKPIQGMSEDATPDTSENGAVVLEALDSPWLPICNGEQVIA